MFTRAYERKIILKGRIATTRPNISDNLLSPNSEKRHLEISFNEYQIFIN